MKNSEKQMMKTKSRPKSKNIDYLSKLKEQTAEK